MNNIVYVYIDGESHYIRSEQACKELFGEDCTLAEISNDNTKAHNTHYGPLNLNSHQGPVYLRCMPKASFFWDALCVQRALRGRPDTPPVTAHRRIYFTSVAGDDSEVFEVNRFIRNEGFEPYVVKERRTLKSQRANVLKNEHIIEKAKGVDLALGTRMLEDANLGNYSSCYLFTSDVDFLPVVEAVRRMGKGVYVVGVAEGLGDQSKLLFVPDLFVNIGREMMEKCYSRKAEPIDAARRSGG